jgi:hypothetical protein
MVDRHRSTLIVATLMSVLLSILGVGALTKPLLQHLLGEDSTSGGRPSTAVPGECAVMWQQSMCQLVLSPHFFLVLRRMWLPS